jgi:hypothetical protein
LTVKWVALFYLERIMESQTIDPVRTRKEAAEFLRVSVRTLTRRENAGDLSGRIRISDRIYGYRQSTLDAYLSARTEA